MSRRLIIVAAVALVSWGIWGYFLVKPVDHHDFRTAAVHAAQSTDDTVQTVLLAGQAELSGQVLPTYLQAVLDDSQDTLGGAAKRLTGYAPPDAATARMRDQLGPLILAAQRGVGDVTRADRTGDDTALRAALTDLDGVGQRLGDFVEAYR